MEYEYVVQLPLVGSDTWHDLCVCLTPATVAQVVMALVLPEGQPVTDLRVIVRPRQERSV